MNKYIIIGLIGLVVLSCGCINQEGFQSYIPIGHSYDIGFVDGHYEQYNYVINIEKIYTEKGYYNRKITFLDGSYKTYSYIIDEDINEGYLYNTVSLEFKDGKREYLTEVVGYETIFRQDAYWNIDIFFGDGSKKALHYVTSYRPIT